MEPNGNGRAACRWTLVPTVAVLIAVIAAVPAIADAAQWRPSGLTVSVADGLGAMGRGDHSDYTITLRNKSSEAAEGLALTATLPEQFRVTRTGHSGAERDGVIAWTVDLEPGRSIRRRFSAHMAGPGAWDRNVAVTACVSRDRDAPPIACGTDVNLLPAGSAPVPMAERGRGAFAVYWLIGALAVLVFAAGTMGAIVIMDRGLRRGDGDGDGCAAPEPAAAPDADPDAGSAPASDAAPDADPGLPPRVPSPRYRSPDPSGTPLEPAHEATMPGDVASP